MMNLDIVLLKPHERQRQFIESKAKRKVIRAGRRGGKTIGMAIYAVKMFLAGRRVLYAAPTQDQVDSFWQAVCNMLESPIDNNVFYTNKTLHIIELSGTKQRIRAKTAWNSDSLRGDFADILILDEYQLMNEDTWDKVGAPMLLDNNGDAVFIYTPPALQSRSASKANDPQHAAKLFKRAAADTSGRWETFHFTSYENPYISKVALGEISSDMTSLAYRMEILAEDVNENPNALWKRENILREHSTPRRFSMVVVGVDPSATSTGDEAGIMVDGRVDIDGLEPNYYTIADESLQGSPHEWATAAVIAYHKYQANIIVAEKNNGGEMVSQVIHEVDPNVPVELVTATRGKDTRAEPIAVIYEQHRAYHIGNFAELEDELCLWVPGMQSPNRLDAHVWAMTKLKGSVNANWDDIMELGHVENFTSRWK